MQYLWVSSSRDGSEHEASGLPPFHTLGPRTLSLLCKILYSRAQRCSAYQRTMFFRKDGAYVDPNKVRGRSHLFYLEEKRHYSHLRWPKWLIMVLMFKWDLHRKGHTLSQWKENRFGVLIINAALLGVMFWLRLLHLKYRYVISHCRVILGLQIIHVRCPVHYLGRSFVAKIG